MSLEMSIHLMRIQVIKGGQPAPSDHDRLKEFMECVLCIQWRSIRGPDRGVIDLVNCTCVCSTMEIRYIEPYRAGAFQW
jgi:hypothetical protein